MQKRLPWILLALALIVTLGALSAAGGNALLAADTEAVPEIYSVLRVIDGDTIQVDFNGEKERVRLIGVDTPESVHPDAEKNNAYGDIASAYTEQQLADRKVGLEFDVSERDQYGRLLAYVYIDGRMFNKTLLEMGYAAVSTWPPNVKYVDDFTAIQQAARGAGAGFWADYAEPAGAYLGSVNSDKFHAPDCRQAETIKEANRIWFDSREEAAAAGYTPCSVCQP